MKKPEWNSKTILTLAGAAVMAGSLITVFDFAYRRKHAKVSHAAELVLGLAGVALGAVLAAEPERRAYRSAIEVDEMFDDLDAALAHEQIREALNSDVDRAVQSAEHLRTIEVDNETSIEDFI